MQHIPDLPPVRLVQTVFDKESVQVTLQNAVEEILKDQPYDHTKVRAAQAPALSFHQGTVAIGVSLHLHLHARGQAGAIAGAVNYSTVC